jgi:iron complex outermembrane recepter protein
MSLKRKLRGAAAAAATFATTFGSAAELAHPPQEVIVTGTRRTERTAADSNVPVDVVSQDDLRRTPAADLNNKLQSLVPSYNVKRLPLSDGAIFVRPASLRSLSPDQTLVLVNGKRWHRSAFVDVTSRGSQAVDLSQIPQVAIQRIEVLRDGASAQYGSDAIAGVINLILEDRNGGDAYAQFGEYSEGDGRNVQAAFRAGLGLGASGHVNLSFQYANADATSRSIQRPQAQALIALGEPYASTVRQPVVQRFGQPDLEDYRFFYNAGYELNDSIEAYAFGNYAYSEGVNDFNWRAPAAAGGFGQSSAYDRSVFQNGPDALFPDWDLRSVFPGGFTPRFGSKQDDYSSVVGARGELTPKLSWDASVSFGHNTIEYLLTETINASLGPLSPTEFDAGSREQEEINANLDFVYRLRLVNVAFGAEHRREEFTVNAGEEASWVVGPLRDLAPASNGFPGASPASAGTWSIRSNAAYIDLDVDVNTRWNVGVAGRFEDYSSFGSTRNGKISTRFKVVDSFHLRGAASTGFRAPTPGQANLTNTNQFPDPAGVVRTRGTIPPTSAGALLLGASPLTPEESTNFSLGFVLTPANNLTLSVDAYRIDIDDRIGLSRSFVLTDTQRAQLVAAGVSGASELYEANFFTNGFNTQTEGIDAVLSWRTSIGPGTLGVTSAYNHNRTKVTQSDPGVISDQTRLGLEKGIPQDTTNLSIDYTWRQWSLFARGRHFGEWVSLGSTTDPAFNQTVGEEVFLDLAATYAATDTINVTLGADNLLDSYSDKAQFLTFVGRVYPTGLPYENDGRQAYLRVGIKF